MQRKTATKRATEKKVPSVVTRDGEIIVKGQNVRGTRVDVTVNQIMEYETSRGRNTYRMAGTYTKRDGGEGGFNSFISKALFDELQEKGVPSLGPEETSGSRSSRKREPKPSCLKRAHNAYNRCAKTYGKPRGTLKLVAEEEEEEKPRRTKAKTKTKSKSKAKRRQIQEEEEEREEEPSEEEGEATFVEEEGSEEQESEGAESEGGESESTEF